MNTAQYFPQNNIKQWFSTKQSAYKCQIYNSSSYGCDVPT